MYQDEVGELPSAAQVKLLRALQESEVEPVGGRKAVKVDVRIISATNRDLIADVKAGRFREDLFYRLHVFPILVPPLRRRPEDIPELARHFLARAAAEERKRVRGLTNEAVALLCGFAWPGNVRQLENAIFRAVVLTDGEEIGLDEFPQISARASTGTANEFSMQPLIEPSPTMAPEDHGTAASMMTADALALLDKQGDVRPLEEIEKEVIQFAIDHYRGQMSEVARRLRIGRSTLYRKLETLRLFNDDRDRGTIPHVD